MELNATLLEMLQTPPAEWALRKKQQRNTIRWQKFMTQITMLLTRLQVNAFLAEKKTLLQEKEKDATAAYFKTVRIEKPPIGVQLALEHLKGMSLPDSKVPGRVPKNLCKHPVEKLAVRANGELRRIICLDCSSMWGRLHDDELLERVSFMFGDKGMVVSDGQSSQPSGWTPPRPKDDLEKEFPPDHHIRKQLAKALMQMRDCEQVMKHLLKRNPGQTASVVRLCKLVGLTL